MSADNAGELRQSAGCGLPNAAGSVAQPARMSVQASQPAVFEEEDLARMRRTALALLLLIASAAPALSQVVSPQNSKPAPTPRSTRSRPRAMSRIPGTIQLTVDAMRRHARRSSRFTSTCRCPGAGDFVMLYPKWLPGNHSADRARSTRSRVSAPTRTGQELKWVRDDLDVYAFHIAVPQGVSAIDVDFQYVSPTAGEPGPRRRHAPTWRASSGSPIRCTPRAISCATFRSRRQ